MPRHVTSDGVQSENGTLRGQPQRRGRRRRRRGLRASAAPAAVDAATANGRRSSCRSTTRSRPPAAHRRSTCSSTQLDLRQSPQRYDIVGTRRWSRSRAVPGARRCWRSPRTRRSCPRRDQPRRAVAAFVRSAATASGTCRSSRTGCAAGSSRTWRPRHGPAGVRAGRRPCYVVRVGRPARKLYRVSTPDGTAADVTPRPVTASRRSSVSPDGRRVAFIAGGQAYVSSLVVDERHLGGRLQPAAVLADQMNATAVAWTNETWLNVAARRAGPGDVAGHRRRRGGPERVRQPAGLEGDDLVAYPSGRRPVGRGAGRTHERRRTRFQHAHARPAAVPVLRRLTVHRSRPATALSTVWSTADGLVLAVGRAGARQAGRCWDRQGLVAHPGSIWSCRRRVPAAARPAVGCVAALPGRAEPPAVDPRPRPGAGRAAAVPDVRRRTTARCGRAILATRSAAGAAWPARSATRWRRVVARRLAGPAAGPVALVPVPATAAAIRARHGDHMLRLARAGRPALRGTGIRRRVATPLRARPKADSAHLDRAQRAAAARPAFVVRPDARSCCADARRRRGAVVLVDDVLTTGSTLAAVAEPAARRPACRSRSPPPWPPRDCARATGCRDRASS